MPALKTPKAPRQAPPTPPAAEPASAAPAAPPTFSGDRFALALWLTGAAVMATMLGWDLARAIFRSVFPAG